MSDTLLFAGWTLVLAAGLGFCVLLRRIGLGATYVRDLLHVGAGIWVLGWPWWEGWLAPTLLVAAAVAGTACMPRLARRRRWARRFVESVTSRDEHYEGLWLYALSFAGLTVLALAWQPLPAAAALLALSLGDGVGGALGRRFGRHPYRVAGGKAKSLEGSVGVAVAAGAGVWLSSHWFGVPVTVLQIGALALVAALAEAASPRGRDNVVVPAAVFAVGAALL